MDVFNTYKELGLGSRMARLSERVMKEIQLVYDRANIDFDPYHFPIFKIIVDQEITTTTQIKELLHISQPAVTQAINKLKKKQLIEFADDKTDGRIKLISLSSQGKALLPELKVLWRVIESEVKQLTQKQTDNLIEHLHHFETQMEKEKLSDRIMNKYQTTLTQEMEIIPFETRYAEDFKELNVAWLKKYFVVEPHDEDLLSRCEENIINKGGHIFFARMGEEIAGTFSLIKVEEGVYELGKMAVDPKFQGQRIGQKLMEFCIDFSRKQSWDKLLLYSNTKLENAIHIYRKYGFKEIELEKNVPYLRSNIKMELPLS
ncbi:GNAT family N-acetyltransferase [Leptobacterium flavescens]|uniref:GNAT family N-acetyltransferase n=1 Tax=Leptobacterium flavescens TaxID=472055 RepID=A0A6P0UKV5_9FLAO|nr:bifunctional helix-turn-helix transcriptional regulator/GNAT family N-acetyltransferase [Leptobacterium flavescens]NER13854.1 GNAT family N-acetyltransferase [Leptobacterium flavescens]